MNDEFGDRMKLFEGFETNQCFMPMLPIVVRLDGRSFSAYTKGLERPFDITFKKAMAETTKRLVEETNAIIGYTQSDEITLILYSDNMNSQVWFNGEKFKIVSCLASLCSVTLDRIMYPYFVKKGISNRLPTFDCRAYNVPSKTEAVNALLWREMDAYKNSVSSAARFYHSHNELDRKNTDQKKEMLLARGVTFEDYPDICKRGVFVQRKKTIRGFTQGEIELLSIKHEARSNPDLMVERTDVVEIKMPKFVDVANRVEVVFDGEEPIVSKCIMTENCNKFVFTL